VASNITIPNDVDLMTNLFMLITSLVFHLPYILTDWALRSKIILRLDNRERDAPLVRWELGMQ
jgi:hypothetical protein